MLKSFKDAIKLLKEIKATEDTSNGMGVAGEISEDQDTGAGTEGTLLVDQIDEVKKGWTYKDASKGEVLDYLNPYKERPAISSYEYNSAPLLHKGNLVMPRRGNPYEPHTKGVIKGYKPTKKCLAHHMEYDPKEGCGRCNMSKADSCKKCKSPLVKSSLGGVRCSKGCE